MIVFATGAVGADLLLAQLDDIPPGRVELEPLEVVVRRTT